MSRPFRSKWEARVAATAATTDARAPSLVATTEMPELEAAHGSLLDAVLAVHPHLQCTDEGVLRAFDNKEHTAEMIDEAALVIAAHQLETAIAAQSPAHAEILEAMRTLDLDDRDRLYAVLSKEAPGYAAALRAGASTDEIVARTSETLDCGPSGKKQKKSGGGAMMTVPLERAGVHYQNKEARKKQRQIYGDKIAEWRALDDVELNEMLDEWLASDPSQLHACIDAGISLEGIKGFFRRNFGSRKAKEEQAKKDVMKARQRRERKAAKEKGEDVYGLGALSPDDEMTAEAELEDGGADDPFGSEYAREQQKLAATLDGEPLEVNIFKEVKKAAARFKRGLGSAPAPLALEPFARSQAASPADGGALLSLLSEKDYMGALLANATRGRTIAKKVTLFTRDLNKGGKGVETILYEKTADIRTFLISRGKGELTALGGTKIVAVDLMRYAAELRNVEIAQNIQFELIVRLEETELAQMDSSKRDKEKITLHLRPTSDAAAAGDAVVWHTTHGNPLVIFQFVGGVLCYVYLVVLPSDVSPGEALRGHVAPMARWLTHAAQSKETLEHAHEELRSYAMLPAPDMASKRNQARANHVLEEVMRQKLMAALAYEPTKGVYPIDIMLRTKAEKPSVAASQDLRRAMDALIAAPASASNAQLASALLTELSTQLADPATLRSITSVVSQALHAGGARSGDIGDAGHRLANLWNPRYNKLVLAYFKWDSA